MKNALFKYLIEVNDVNFINQRIKEYDKSFYLFYNKKFKRYEVHNLSLTPSFCISFNDYPNTKLLIKLDNYLNKSLHKLSKEIEIHNAKLAKYQSDKLSELSTDQLREIINFSHKKLNQNLSSNQIRKIIENKDIV